MATRTDVFIRWVLNPRIIEVMSPSVEMTVQDLVDTIRKLEDQFDGMSFPHLLNAGGKEDLGGGIAVGITSTLQDAQILFEGMPLIVSSGTVTTGSGTIVRRAIRLFDSVATFIADGVERGYVILNYTDRSVAEVLDVVSETELLVGVPVQGTFNDFRIADEYGVSSVIRPTIRGGNVVAVDDIQVSIDVGLTAAMTMLTVEKSTSAALVSADTLLLERIEKILRNKMITDPIGGTITVYDDDGITVLLSASIFQDAAGLIPYAGQGAERRERLV